MGALFLFPLIVSVCFSFLLDNTTPNPYSEILLTDKHYYSLLDMITEEIHYRQQLQQVVIQLQSELAQSEVKSARQCAELKNITDLVERDFEQIHTEYNTPLKRETRQLKQDYEQFRKQDFVNAQNKIIQLEIELAYLKQLKTFQEQHILVLTENKTQHLIQEIQSANSKVDILMSERTARTDDLLALFNKTLTSERKITFLEQSVETNFAILQTGHNKTVHDLLTNISMVESDCQSLNNSFAIQYANLESKFENKIAELRSNQNSIEAKLSSTVKQIEKANEKVAMTACTNRIMYSHYNTIIEFPDVRSSVGISKDNSFWSTGKFTCEKPGLYMFAAHIMCSAARSEYMIVKDGQLIAKVYIKPDLSTTDFYTASGVVVVELNVNETVFIKTFADNMDLYGIQFSCLSVIKIK